MSIDKTQDNEIERIRKINKSIGLNKLSKTISVTYFSLCLVMTGTTLVNVVNEFITSPIFPISQAFHYSYLPIFIANILLYLNSYSFYETYFVVWDDNLKDRFLSTLLWLFHLPVLIGCYYFPEAWLLVISFLLFLVYLKNKISYSRVGKESPAAVLLGQFTKRSATHFLMALFFGAVLLSVTSDWFYIEILGVDVSSDDVKMVLHVNRIIVNSIVVMIIGISSIAKLKIEDEFAVYEIEKYENKMNKYISENKRNH